MKKTKDAIKPLKLDLLPVDAGRRILQMRASGYTLQNIQDWVNDNYQLNASIEAVRKWLNRRANTISTMVYGSDEFKNKVSEEYAKILVDYSGAARTILKVLERRGELDENEEKPGVRAQYVRDISLMEQSLTNMVDRLQKILLTTQGIPEMELNVPSMVDKLKAGGLIIKRSVSPE